MKKLAKEKSKRGNKKRGYIVFRIFLIILLIAVIYGVTFTYKVKQNGGGIQGILKTSLGHDSNTVNNLDKIYCLVLGQSQHLTDTIMLASYDPKTQEAALLSIPRDTFIGVNKAYASSYDKINAVYQTGVDNLLEDVENITGINVEYYLKVDTEALKVLVDEIGGVYFDVPIDMHYTDRGQGLYIDLKAGEQLLDGDKAEQVVRFRHNSDGTTYPLEYGGEDLGRMRTQRAFLTALLEQTIENMDVNMIFDFLDIAKEYVETNLDFEAIKDYVPYVLDFKIEDLKTATLPGIAEQAEISRIWIYTVYEDEAKEVIDELFYGKEPEKITVDEENIIESENIVNEETSLEPLNIEIINGSGSISKVTEVIKELEAAGYNIINQSNTSTTENSIVINRKNVQKADESKIKKIMGIEELISGEKQNNIDITIIIGTDYII